MDDSWRSKAEAAFWGEHNMKRNQLALTCKDNENAAMPTRDKMRADLARAMGYRIEAQLFQGHIPYFELLSPQGGECVEPYEDESGINDLAATEEEAWKYAPNPFTNADDKDALVKWLAADDARWKEFKQELLSDWVSSPEQDVVRFVLTAPLETIAEAAFFAITR